MLEMFAMTEEQFLSIFETSIDFIHDYNNSLECNRIIQNYDRSNARRFLSDMTNEYQNEINLFGLLFDGVHTTTCPNFSDYEILDQINYLSSHIPVYSLIRKGDVELAKRVFQWIEGKLK